MALTNHEMCSRFDDFVISITKTGGVLDFKLHRIFIWKTLMLFDIHIMIIYNFYKTYLFLPLFLSDLC